MKSILCLTFFPFFYSSYVCHFFFNELTFRFPLHSYSTFYTLSLTTLFIPLFFVSLADVYFISFHYILLLNVLFLFFWQSKTCLLYLWPAKFILYFFYRLRYLFLFNCLSFTSSLILTLFFVNDVFFFNVFLLSYFLVFNFFLLLHCLSLSSYFFFASPLHFLLKISILLLSPF